MRPGNGLFLVVTSPFGLQAPNEDAYEINKYANAKETCCQQKGNAPTRISQVKTMDAQSAEEEAKHNRYNFVSCFACLTILSLLVFKCLLQFFLYALKTDFFFQAQGFHRTNQRFLLE